MTEISTIPDKSSLEKYCTSCGVPPLFVNQKAEEILGVLEGRGENLPNIEGLRKALAQLKRFPQHFKYNQGIRMNYQDYVGVHQERMYMIGEMFEGELLELGIDTNILKFLCRYHDAPEALSIFGDIPTPIKEAFDEEVENIHVLYERAIVKVLSEQILTGDVGIPNNQIHTALLLSVDKKELIGQLLSYLDKFDAMMVSFHEVMSGNKNFFVKKLGWYKKFFAEVHSGKRLPLLQDFIKCIPPENSLSVLFDAETWKQMETAKKNTSQKQPYTEEDIERDYGVPAYMIWKKATQRIEKCTLGDQELSGIDILIQQRK